jgi:hypothetical protein
MLTATTDTWDYRRAFRTSLSLREEGRGRWTANTPALGLRFEIEHHRISQVAVLQISSAGGERYDFVPPTLTEKELKDLIEERLVDEILSAYARAPG